VLQLYFQGFGHASSFEELLESELMCFKTELHMFVNTVNSAYLTLYYIKLADLVCDRIYLLFTLQYKSNLSILTL